MGDELLSTRDAAAVLGVGTTTIKRWSDAGLLQCVKTPGKHRRFLRREVDRLLRSPAAPLEAPSARVQQWIDVLLGTAPGQALQSELLADRASLGSWWRVAELQGEVLDEIGKRWEQGSLTVLEEHVASDRLARALQRVSEDLPVSPQALRALLVVAEGEEHTLGLSLVELCVREAGLASRWAGRRTPLSEVAFALRRDSADVVIVSASASGHTAAELERQALHLGEVCRAAGAELILGGSGPWPDPPPAGRRLRSFEQLAEVLGELAALVRRRR